MKITALSNHKPRILNNYIRIIFLSNMSDCRVKSINETMWVFLYDDVKKIRITTSTVAIQVTFDIARLTMDIENII